MQCLYLTVVLLGCQLWCCCYSYRPEIGVGSATVITTTSYIIHAGSTIDGIADVAACSSSSSVALTSCNLRSAWALCQSLITAVNCPSLGSQSTLLVTCAIVLPSTSTIQVQKAYGSNGLDLSGLSTWAASCQHTQVSLSIASSTSSRPAIIVGDSSSAPLLNLRDISFVDLTMENITITGFGDGKFPLCYSPGQNTH